MQDRESLSINRSDTSIQPFQTIRTCGATLKNSTLSSREFVGMVADDPDNKIDLKTFHCEILNDHDAAKQDSYKNIPVIRKLIIQGCRETIYRLSRMYRILYRQNGNAR